MGCADCNTTLEGNPEYHKTPEPHQWKTYYRQSNGQPYQMCERCHERNADFKPEALQIDFSKLDVAFNLAEEDTAKQFTSQTCSLTNKDGESECQICFFRRKVKEHLGIFSEVK
jgi:hypothetical protein